MWDERYSVLRTNGVLFACGFGFMGLLAGLGGLLGSDRDSAPVSTAAAFEVEIGSFEPLWSDAGYREGY